MIMGGELPDFAASTPGIPEQLPFLPYHIQFFYHSRDLNSGTFLHERYILIHLLKGSMRIIVDKQPFDLKTGQLFLIFPGKSHQLIRNHEESSALFASFHVKDDRRQLASLNGCVLTMDYGMKQQLARTVECFMKYYRNQGDEINLVTYRFGEFLERLRLRNSSRLPSSFRKVNYSDSGSELFRKISQYVVEHPCRRISIEELSKILNVSCSHLRRCFRKHYGMSLGFYLRTRRMNYAVGLLRSSDMNIAQIASLCGYESASAFSRAFKREEKLHPPHEYRKLVRHSESEPIPAAEIVTPRPGKNGKSDLPS